MTRPQISHGPLLVSIACARPFGLMGIAPLKLSVRCVEVSWFLLIWSFGFFVHRRGAAAYLRVEWGHSKMNDFDQFQLFERLQLSWQMPFLLIKCYRFPVIRHPQGFVELGAEIQMEVEDVLRMIPPRGHVPQQLSVVARFCFILFCHCNFLA